MPKILSVRLAVWDQQKRLVARLPTRHPTSLVPRPPCPAFVTCSTKRGEKAWMDLSRYACRCWCHVL